MKQNLLLITVLGQSKQIFSTSCTNKSKICFSFFMFSVSNFVGFELAKALVSDNGSDILLIQHIVPSHAGAKLNNATLRFSS